MIQFEEYMKRFEELMALPNPPSPYDDEQYLHYAKLNLSRTNRWLNRGLIDPALQKIIKEINAPQQWILITEPWCGDAAHSVPFIYKAAQLNPLIDLIIEYRDQEPFRINEYLTDGGKSIPMLIIRDEHGVDLGVWGPRPEEAQALHYKMKEDELDFEAQIELMQKWYNEDKGRSLQVELGHILMPIKDK